MKRLALFAGFDKDNEISSYVVHYLRELSTRLKPLEVLSKHKGAFLKKTLF